MTSQKPPPLQGAVIVTADELMQIVNECVRVALRDEIGELVQPRFLTTADVAAMLQVCTKQVGILVKTQGLPVARQLGRESRFERDAVVQWMRDG